jgi:hypothetical protein
MKHASKLLVAILFTFVAVSAFAAGKNSDTVTLAEPAVLGSTKLPAGQYKVSWDGSGPNVTVTVKNDATTATVPAQFTEKKNSVRSVSTRSENGERVITGMDLHHGSLTFVNAPRQQSGQ